MKNFKRTKLVFFVVLITTIIVNGQMPFSDPTGNWELLPAYSDEFEGSLDNSKWDNNIADWGDWSWEPENAWTSKGNLVIRMQYSRHARNGKTLFYTSGIIRSKADPILYGYFEAKMKGADRFPGVCPAFWLYKQTSNLWTEIDIMEMQENSWDVHKLDMNTHTFKPTVRHEKRHWNAPWDPKDDFHVYGCKWDKNGITWYIDGIERANRKNDHWHQALDIAVSMGLREPLKTTSSSSGFPTNFETEYVRVWRVGSGNIVPVTGVSVSPTSTTLNSAGATKSLSETVIPSSATNKAVNWSSNNTSVATVNNSGVVTAVSNGNATISVTTNDGNYTALSDIKVDINTTTTQTPYGGVNRAIPGTIEFEDFDNGGEGDAYHDTDTKNSGSKYRTSEGVDIESCSEGGYNVGWLANGEWLEYTVNVAAAGYYKMDIRYASSSKTGTVHINFNGSNKTGAVRLPKTGGWQTYKTVTKTVNLSVGKQVMRFAVDAAGINLNKINYTATTSGEGNSTKTVTLPAINDAYLQGTTKYNNDLMRIEAGRRVGFLMFDLSEISGSITSAKLKLKCSGDAGNGNIEIGLGNNSNWTDNNISNSNKPSWAKALGSLNSNYAIGTVYTWNLNAASINSGGKVSLILQQTNGNDLAFASKENSLTGPQLVISYTTNKSALSELIATKSDIEMDIYPNPLDGESLNIALKNVTDETTICIMDMQGKIVYQQVTVEQHIKINFRDYFNPGLYLVQITSGSIVKTQKIIIQ